MVPVDLPVNGVEFILSNFDRSKAGGLDGIPFQFLKEMTMDLAPALTQASLHKGDVPDNLKKTQVVPIYNKSHKVIII